MTESRQTQKSSGAQSRQIQKFNGTDYMLWATLMRNILTERDLVQYIQPSNRIMEYNEKEDQQALAEIQFTLDRIPLRSVIRAKTAYEAWITLKQDHEHSSKSNHVFLKNRFYGLQMTDKETIKEFANRITELAEQLENISGTVVPDEDKAIVLMRGIPEIYHSVIVSMQESGNTDSFQHVVNSLLNEESHLNEGRGESSNSSNQALYSNMRGRGQMRGRPQMRDRGQSQRGQGGRPFQNRNFQAGNRNIQQTDNRNQQSQQSFQGNCHQCGKYGHRVSECRNNFRRFEGNCNYCHQYGHKESECRRKQSGNSTRGNYSYRGNYDQFRGRRVFSNFGQSNFGPSNAQAFISEAIADALIAEAMTANNKGDLQTKWIMDSGASDHMTPNKSLLVNYTEFKTPVDIRVGNKHIIPAYGKGDIHMDLDIFGHPGKGILMNVLYAPQLFKSLFSIGKATDQGLKLVFIGNRAMFYNRRQPVMTAAKVNGLYYINGTAITYSKDNSENNEQVDVTANYASSKMSSLEIWHQRLGHIGEESLKHMIKNQSVMGLNDISGNVNIPFCESCAMCKLTRLPFSHGQAKHANQKLHIVHSDVCGPMKNLTHSGNRYFVTFIDDYTRKAHVYFMRNKYEVFGKFQEYKALVENLTNSRIKILRSDRGGEYMNQRFSRFLQQSGIRHQLTAPYTPQQNGVAERFNRTIVEMGRTMLNHAKLPYVFWADAVHTAVFVRNRCISQALGTNRITPEELWSGWKPNVADMKVFGCEAYAMDNHYHWKFEPKAEKCIFIGYADESKAYRLWNVKRNKLIISRNVKFNERGTTSGIEGTVNANNENNEVRIPSYTRNTGIHIEEIKDSEEQHLEEIANDNQSEHDDQQESSTSKGKEVEGYESRNLQSDLGPYWEPLRIGKRTRHQVDYAYAFLAASSIMEPQTYDEALQSPEHNEWQEAMEKEYKALIDNNTWSLVPEPKDKQIIDTKWVYKIKLTANGTIDKYKARFVVKGYTQQFGIDFNEIFAPVFKLTSFRLILSIGASLDLEIHQMDVNSAFLNGNMDTTIFIRQPKGFVKNPNLVCKLNKSLYGLKQSARLWNECINDYLVEIGFIRCTSDSCIYRKTAKSGQIIILGIWVDDIVIIAPSNDIVIIKQTLQKKFKMSDQGEISYMLGISIKRDRKKRTIHLNQSRYIESILHKFSMDSCKPVNSPADVSMKLMKSNKLSLLEDIPYRQAIGTLMYLMVATRPDISYIITKLSQYNTCYDEQHWIAVKRVFRYLQGSKHCNLSLGNVNGNRKHEIILYGSSDADWAGDLDDRHSTSGYIFQINGGSISWKSQKQSTTATSTSHSEYMALSSSVKEAIWIRSLLKELHFEQKLPTIIEQDNQSTIALANNPVHHQKSKHIEISHHHIRENIENGTIKLQYTSTKEIISDILTKPVNSIKLQQSCELLGIK